MSEQKPESKLITVSKMVAICAICVGTIYGIVTLVTFLTS